MVTQVFFIAFIYCCALSIAFFQKGYKSVVIRKIRKVSPLTGGGFCFTRKVRKCRHFFIRKVSKVLFSSEKQHIYCRALSDTFYQKGKKY